MEKLSQLIEDIVINGLWKPMGMGRLGPYISHLMFADDLMLFVEPSTDQMVKVLDCLNNFCNASRHKVNSLKTSIIFSKNVPNPLQHQILSFCGFRENGEIGRYLGSQLSNGCNKKGGYKEVLTRTQNKLHGWKTHCFSLAGCITLAQSILGTTMLYNMQNSKIPKIIRDEVEKIQ